MSHIPLRIVILHDDTGHFLGRFVIPKTRDLPGIVTWNNHYHVLTTPGREADPVYRQSTILHMPIDAKAVQE